VGLGPLPEGREEQSSSSSEAPSEQRRLNYLAASVLQSGVTGGVRLPTGVLGGTTDGVPGSFPLWDLGVDGSGQFVSIADTGFDDASCFLRDAGSKDFLNGFFNTVHQTERSTLAAPVTELGRRKVVQYLATDLAFPFAFTYDGDGAGGGTGHGSHLAATIAGMRDPSDVPVSPIEGSFVDIVNWCYR
jgi:subtilisin family serine protease